MADQAESRQRVIDQVAVLFPHLTPAERLEWWGRLDCSLSDLTVHMPWRSDRYPEVSP